MTFHKTDRAEFVRSGRKLRDENLQTLAEYFESIYDTRQNDGHYRRMQVEKVRSDAKREMHHELEQRYARKLKRFASERGTGKSYAMRGRGGSDHYRRSEYGRREIDNRDRRYNDKRNDKRSNDKKSPPEREKGFSPVKCTASAPSTPLRSVARIHSIEPDQTHARTITANARMTLTTSTTSATRVATTSCTGATVLPCQAMAKAAPAAKAKLLMTIIT
jgi:hypothetical protein